MSRTTHRPSILPIRRQYEYLTEHYADVLAAADIVVSRAGANSVYELLLLAKPHLLVPLPLAASRGDQIENAEYARERGLSDVIADEQLTAEGLLSALRALMDHLDARRRVLEQFEAPRSVALITALLEAEAR